MADVSCPTAQAMLSLAESLDDHPLQKFLCTWIALDNLIRVVARQSGIKPQFRLRKNGTLQMMEVGDSKMPDIHAPKRDPMLAAVIGKADIPIKHALIAHPSVEYFVNRTPTFENRTVKSDQRGQQLNGVMDVCRTMDVRYPIWSPISKHVYRAFIQGEMDDSMRDSLVMQIVKVLDTIRENMLYADGTNTQECGGNLVACAQPLLNILINGLL